MPLGAAPRDRPEDPPLVAEGHLEVPLLQPARAVDDVDAGRARTPGAGSPAPNGASDATCAATAPVMRAEAEGAVDPQARPQVVGAEPLVGVVVDARRGARESAPASSVRPAACLVAAESRAAAARTPRAPPSMSNGGNAAARAVGHVAVDRQHDGRAVERVDELRRDDPDDAAVPALARDDEHGARTDVGIVLDQLARLGHDGGFLLLPARVLVVELLGQRPRFLGQRLVDGQQQPRRDVGRAHAARGVDARRDHEADVIAVDGLARRGRTTRAAPAGRPCAVPSTAGRARASR